MLGRHRLKTYGFLDLSFKAGRSKTLGGFGGGFDDRLWDKMDGELDLARLERYTRYPQATSLRPAEAGREHSHRASASGSDRWCWMSAAPACATSPEIAAPSYPKTAMSWSRRRLQALRAAWR